MQLLLDTADPDEWARLLPTGLFTGITTNPLLLSRANMPHPDWPDLFARAARLGAQALHVQVTGPVDSYVKQAERIYALGTAAGIEGIVKVPCVGEALPHVSRIKALGGRVLLTAVYDAKQMVLASALKADFIAPYFARISEAGHDGKATLADMLAIQRACSHKTTILVASLRNGDQVRTLAAQGHTCFTLPPKVADDLLTDPQTRAAFDEFEAAAHGDD